MFIFPLIINKFDGITFAKKSKFEMQPLNQITTITRRNIADNMTLSKWWYHGRLDEPTFLGRLYDLNSMPSLDHRFSTASKDIHKHTVMNNDWPVDWIFSDSRFNLMYCSDDKFLQFLCETIHPAVRSNETEVQQMLTLYNKYLSNDGFELVTVDEISGRPIFKGIWQLGGAGHLQTKAAEIKRYLSTDYISRKISLMNEAVHKDTDLAIGLAKELLETVCKSILSQKGIAIEKDWTVPKLLKETTANLDFSPKMAPNANKAEQSIRQILSGIGIIIQGITGLRNSYGSGHGKDANFQGLEPKFAKLVVGLTAEIAILYLTTNGAPAELIESSEAELDLPF